MGRHSLGGLWKLSPQAVMLVRNTLTILLLQLLGIVIQGQEFDDSSNGTLEFEDMSNGTLEFEDRSIGMMDYDDRGIHPDVGTNNVRCGKSTTRPTNNESS